MEITITYKDETGFNNHLIIEDGTEDLINHIQNIVWVRSLYSNGKFTKAEEETENLCVQLNDLVKRQK